MKQNTYPPAQDLNGEENNNGASKPRLAGNLQFGIAVMSKVGYQLGGSSGGNFGDCSGRNSSKPNSNNGLFQHQVQEGMEGHFSSNREECEGWLLPLSDPAWREATKLIQVFKPTMAFNLHMVSQEMELGVLQHMVTLLPGEGQMKEVLKQTGWNLREEAKLGPPFDECPTPDHTFLMNIIIWNCRGALKPSFQNRIRELVQNHNPVILVIMETQVGGERVREITDKLPFDGAIHTDTIGYASGLWVLWNSDRVEVSPLSSTEHEIHTMVKVRFSNACWLLSAMHASPRSAERQILWNNLIKVADLHNMPWVIAGDFNEPLVDGDKFGGRAVSVNRSLLFKECLDKCSMINIGFVWPRFTWTNIREVLALIQERIDKFFVIPS